LQDLFRLDYQEGDFILSGYISKPTLLKGTRQWQIFNINSRVIVNRMLNKAVDVAYQTLIPQGSFPLVFLDLITPKSFIDVNVHPQKMEVKFQDDRAIFHLIHNGIRSVLTTPATVSDRSTTFYNYPPQQKTQYFQDNLIHQNSTNVIFRDGQSTNYDISATEYSNSPDENCDRIIEEPRNESDTASLAPMGQVANCYIIAKGGEDLYIIDQHAAHERLLFEKLSAKTIDIPLQTLLIPVLIELDPLEVRQVEEILPLFINLGFELDWAGPTVLRLTELPCDLAPQEAKTFIQQILSIVSQLKTPTPADLRLAVIESSACHMAVRSGQALNHHQLKALLDELSASPLPYTCPHGRPTIIRFTPSDLGRLFKRT